MNQPSALSITCPFCRTRITTTSSEFLILCPECHQKFLIETAHFSLDHILEEMLSAVQGNPKLQAEIKSAKAQTKKLNFDKPEKSEEDTTKIPQFIGKEVFAQNVQKSSDETQERTQVFDLSSEESSPSVEKFSGTLSPSWTKEWKLQSSALLPSSSPSQQIVACPYCHFSFRVNANALVVCCIQCLKRFVPPNTSPNTKEFSSNLFPAKVPAPPLESSSLIAPPTTLSNEFKPNPFSTRFEAMLQTLVSANDSQTFLNQDQLNGSLLVGQTLFRVEKKIADGGMGSIYQAKMICGDGFEKTVALKTLRPQYAQDAKRLSMFIGEARVMAALKHHNIAAIYSFGKFRSMYFYAMEYVEGRNLYAFQKRHQKLNRTAPIGILVYILTQICNALHYIHTKRDNRGKPLELIHRDISPQNIMFSLDGVVKVMDFGVAKGKSIASSQKKTLAGKLNYTAPEMALFREVDHRADIYSLGVVFYEMITGRLPFQWNNPIEMNQQIEHATFDPPSKYRKIPEELEKIILKTMSKDPKQRWADAATLGFALNRFLYTKGLLFNEQTLANYLKGIFKNLGNRIVTTEQEDEIELELARQAISQEILSQQQLKDCLKEQAERSCDGEYLNLGAIFVQKGLIHLDDFQKLLSQQNIEVMRCSSCGNQYYVRTSSFHLEICLRCASPLELPKKLESALVDGQILEEF